MDDDKPTFVVTFNVDVLRLVETDQLAFQVDCYVPNPAPHLGPIPAELMRMVLSAVITRAEQAIEQIDANANGDEPVSH